jgi:lysophospholipase L1-like esterase
MTRVRRSDIAAVVIVLAIIGGIASIYASANTPASEAASSSSLDYPLTSTSDNYPMVLFIGDSYVAGKGSAEMSYGCKAALRMGWLCRVAAIGGTGYISGGPANRWVVDQYTGKTTSFIERIGRLASQYHPDFVVLDGGRNDQLAPPDVVLQAMVATITEAHRTWPAAKIVVLRPRFLARPGDDLGYDDDFMAHMRANPAAAGVVFLDPIGSFIGTDTSDLVGPDQIHPNRAGEARLSDALYKALAGHSGVMS